MKIICPKCKSKNIIPIVYGYPSSELFELSEQGKVKLGGCEQVFGDRKSTRLNSSHEFVSRMPSSA